MGQHVGSTVRYGYQLLWFGAQTKSIQRAKEELNHQTCGFNVFHRKIAPEIVLLVTRLPRVFGDYKYEGRQVGFHENCTKHGE